MRSLIVAAVLCVAATASGQNIYTPGYYGGVGPWQPSRVSPSYLYYNHSAPVYPIARPYGYGYGGAAYWQREETNYELRQIRREIEDSNWRRRGR
jgi:hypothetical protein